MTTYAAVLRDRQIEWLGDQPRKRDDSRPLKVFVTVPDEASIPAVNQGRQMAAALERLAQLRAFQDTEPLQWQRDIRVDRPLPNRVE